MGLLQKAVETYESHRIYASENRDSKTMMAPVGHIITRAELEITLDEKPKDLQQPGQTPEPTVPEQLPDEADVPQEGSFEEWYKYFFPFFGND
jgi:hypothetical protein